MNSIYKLGCVIICLVLTACMISDDGGYGDYIDVEVKDAFTFDNQKNYVVGDTIFFDQKFSRYINEAGFDSLLDVFETTNDSKFGYGFDFNKFSDFSNRYVNISVDSEYIISTTTDATEYYFYDGLGVVAELNATKDAYESRVGVILAETGKFKLKFDYIYFRNDYDGIHLDIVHTFSENSTHDFEFTVEE